MHQCFPSPELEVLHTQQSYPVPDEHVRNSTLLELNQKGRNQLGQGLEDLGSMQVCRHIEDSDKSSGVDDQVASINHTEHSGAYRCTMR
jgi:hypothetical protein